MKICQAHWNALKSEIKSRGLFDFVCASGTEALQQTLDELKGGSKTAVNFDPLLSANWAIMSNAIKAGGLYLMAADADGNEYCPLCEAEKHGCTDWISRAVDGAAAELLEISKKLA